MNPISTQKVAAFDISDYSSFNILLSDASDEVRVSPFTATGLKDELRNQLEGLSLVFTEESPDVGLFFKTIPIFLNMRAIILC